MQFEVVAYFRPLTLSVKNFLNNYRVIGYYNLVY